MARLKERFLATNAVSTPKIIDKNVTKAKLADEMLDQAEGLAMLDASRKLVIDRMPQALLDQVSDHESRLDVLEGRVVYHETVVLTAGEIAAKAFDLTHAPYRPSITILQPVEGTVQLLDTDYTISGTTISWDGKGMEALNLVEGDKIQVWYDFSSGGIAGDLAQEILDRQAGDNALDARLDTLEGQNLDGRLDTLEGQNLDTRVATIENGKGAANGYASLNGAGKVPAAQLPNSIMEYQGTWDVVTNTPALADGEGNSDDAIGNVYRVTVSGSRDLGSGVITFGLGDYAILNASKVWEKADTTDAVSSVNGKEGAVVLGTDDVSEGATNKYFTDERAKSAAVSDAIVDGVTDKAPSQNAVYDANAALSSRVSALESAVVGYLPLGSVIATMPHLTGAYNCIATTAADAGGFVVCEGQTINDPTSPMNGAVIPHINDDVFLMGRATSGEAGGSSTYDFNHTHSVTSNVSVAAHADHTHSVTSNVAVGAHTITQPTFTAPAHYHGMGAGADLNITSSGGHSHTSPGYNGGSGAHNLGGNAGIIYSSETLSGGAHTHPAGNFSGNIGLVTGGANGNAAMTCTRSGDVGLSAHSVTNNAVTSGGASASLTHSVTNNAVTSTSALSALTNIRPPYITARYIMRIK